MVTGGAGRAFITGGSAGIGSALADVFAGHGHDVILVSRNRENLEARGRDLHEKFGVQVTCLPEKMIQLNVTSVVERTKRFLPAMIERRHGRILNVASTAAFVPGPWMSVYYATKAFLLSFSEAIDYELKPKGITVTTLCPGPTQSEFKVRAGSQRSRLFDAFVMDAPRVARVGYDAMMQGKPLAIPGLRNKLTRSRRASFRAR